MKSKNLLAKWFAGYGNRLADDGYIVAKVSVPSEYVNISPRTGQCVFRFDKVECCEYMEIWWE